MDPSLLMRRRSVRPDPDIDPTSDPDFDLAPDAPLNMRIFLLHAS